MRKKKGRIRLFLSYILLIILAISVIYPTLWILVSSFRPGGSIYSPTFFPANPTTEHYTELFTDPKFMFGRWYWNTFKIAVFTMIFGTLGTTLVAYVLSRFRFKGRKAALSTLLILGMFPNFMALISIYLLLYQFDLLNTHLALIIVYACGSPVLSTFIVKGYFDTIPRSLEESARIDGASHMTVFLRLMLPLAKPILTYMAVTTFIGAWVDFILSRLVLRSRDQWTVAVGLWDLATNFRTANFTMFAAGCVMVAVPITVLYLLLQRYIVEGMTAGANKG